LQVVNDIEQEENKTQNVLSRPNKRLLKMQEKSAQNPNLMKSIRTRKQARKYSGVVIRRTNSNKRKLNK